MNSQKEQDYLSKLSDISLRASDFREMLRRSLELVLEIFSCDRAWLLYPADPNAEEYMVPIMRCREGWNVPEGITLPMDEYAQKIINISLNNELPVAFFKDKEPRLPENIIKDYHVQSQLITSINPKLDMTWVFGIHQCHSDREWTEHEVNFLKRISEHISDGLSCSYGLELRRFL